MLVDGGEAIASIHTRTTAHTHSQIHKHRQTHAGARAHAPSLQIMVHSRKFRFGADSGDTKMLHIVRTAIICGITTACDPRWTKTFLGVKANMTYPCLCSNEHLSHVSAPQVKQYIDALLSIWYALQVVACSTANQTASKINTSSCKCLQ